jgi:glutamine amidotransferase
VSASRRVGIVDYGMGNLGSVAKAFMHLGCAVEFLTTPEAVERATVLVLPGVGAFPDAMKNLNSSGLGNALVQASRAGAPLVGICLGMQLLFQTGTEQETTAGLGLLEGAVVRFPEDHALKVPHMGWNQLRLQQASHPLFDGVKDGDHVYFVHSYFPRPTDPGTILATTDYGVDFPSIVGRERVIGIQFHPEKSQRVGLALLENFLKFSEVAG